jgi:hypothetical protein
MRNGFKWLIAPALVVGFLYVVISIVMTPLERGELYPAYSSLRADPLGSKILYESLAELPGLRVERNFKFVATLLGTAPGTLFFIGDSGPSWSSESEEQVKQWETLAAQGWRLVFVFVNALPALDGNFEVFKKEDKKKDKKAVFKAPPILARWGLRLKLRSATAEERAGLDATPRTSALYFETDSSWKVVDSEADGLASHVEKAMGKGSIVAVSEIFPLSNEGLREDREGELVSRLVGANKRIVFDEFHHGVTQAGSIGTMVRRYRLEGAAALLMLTGLLFIWRNATSLLPLRLASEEAIVLGRDTKQGMLSLLQRSVARDDLIAVCLAEWEKARPLFPGASEARFAIARQHPAEKETPAAAYRRIHQALTERK